MDPKEDFIQNSCIDQILIKLGRDRQTEKETHRRIDICIDRKMYT